MGIPEDELRVLAFDVAEELDGGGKRSRVVLFRGGIVIVVASRSDECEVRGGLVLEER